MNYRFARGFIFVGQVTITLALMLYFFKSGKQVLGFSERAKMSQLDYLRPYSFDDLIRKDPHRLMEYAHYFQRVTEFLPQRAEAWSLAGYCFYYLGEIPKAIVSYQKAVEMQPFFFWHPYNLGVIYFKTSRFEEAAAAFQKALRSDAVKTLVVIQASPRIYGPILVLQTHDAGGSLNERLRGGYRKGFTYLGYALRTLGRSEEAAIAFKKAEEFEENNDSPRPQPEEMELELF